jgi:branched-subunit amino acid ABC-type transport system permease component
MVRLLGLVFGIVGIVVGFALIFGAPKFLELPHAAWAVLGGLVLVVLFLVYIMFWTIVHAERLTERRKKVARVSVHGWTDALDQETAYKEKHS